VATLTNRSLLAEQCQNPSSFASKGASNANALWFALTRLGNPSSGLKSVKRVRNCPELIAPGVRVGIPYGEMLSLSYLAAWAARVSTTAMFCIRSCGILCRSWRYFGLL
jgi:hypothetical protein